jgi:hypothetical protein
MCCKHRGCGRLISIIIVLIALILAVTVTFWHQQGMLYVMNVGRFFDAMLPILAVGALLKYLLCSHHGHCCHSGEKDEVCKSDMRG